MSIGTSQSNAEWFQKSTRKDDRIDSENHTGKRHELEQKTLPSSYRSRTLQIQLPNMRMTPLDFFFPSKAEAKFGQVKLLNLSGIIKN